MIESVKAVLLGAMRQMLRPLVRLLLRNGVSYTEYSETVKTVFVEVAEHDFPPAEPSGLVERISLLSGLSQSEVYAVRKAIAESAPVSNENLNQIGGVLAGWHQDPDFTGPYGLPLELPLEGGSCSLSNLVARYGLGAPPKALLEELIRVNAVARLSTDRYRVLTRSYIPAETDPAGLQFMGAALRDLAETLDLNLDHSREGGHFERRVWTPAGIDISELPHFEALVNERGQEFLETLDNWLTAKETEAEPLPPDQKTKVGVGVFLFSDAERKFRDS